MNGFLVMAKLHLVRSSDDTVFGIRHTGGARGAIQEARSTVRLSWRYMDGFEPKPPHSTPPMEVDEVRGLAAELAIQRVSHCSLTLRRGGRAFVTRQFRLDVLFSECSQPVFDAGNRSRAGGCPGSRRT